MADEGAGEAYPFGPFHRLESPTQTPEVARQQETSGEVWGRAPRGSAWPQVQAFRGPLPPGRRGIEFWTELPPDQHLPPGLAKWSGAPWRTDVITEGEFARIRCQVTKNTQEERDAAPGAPLP